jgi:tetratricopeptide (TPR) repeat protein
VEQRASFCPLLRTFDPMTPVDDPTRASFTAWLYRPYIDLTPAAPPGNPQTAGLLYAVHAVEHDVDTARIHGLYAPSFRDAILRQSRFTEYEVDDPVDLPSNLRSTQWETLAANLSELDALPPEKRVRTLWLLHRLHLHYAILRYAPALGPDEIRSAEGAAMAFIRGTARLALHFDGETELDTTELELVVQHAPAGDWAAVEATYYLSAVTAKRKGDAAGVERWTDAHRAQIQAAERDEHTNAKLWSRYHRVRAFVPQLNGDHAGMTAEMDKAQEWAERMSRDTAEREAEANVLAYALWESRTKEALLLGDRDLAEERVRRCIEFAPLDPQAWLDLGQVLVERDDFAGAADAYRTAARFGPPATEAALFMLGQCLEQLGDSEAARDAYLHALDLDPLGVSSLEQLAGLAETPNAADGVVSTWARNRLHELGEAEEAELRPYQQYEGTLGVRS